MGVATDVALSGLSLNRDRRGAVERSAPHEPMNRLLVSSLVALVGAPMLACGSTAAPVTSPEAHPGHHLFEGTAVYRGREGPPPGAPIEMDFVFQGESFRADVVKDGQYVGAVAFHGPSSRLCAELPGTNRWITLDLATLGWLVSLLPPSIRRSAAAEAQARYRWTGRTDSVLGRSCRELEYRSSESTEYWCYSNQEYFGGDARLLPILRQMGYDNTFLSSMSEGGIGWKGLELDAHGVPKFYVEAVRIEPRAMDPALLANVCAS